VVSVTGRTSRTGTPQGFSAGMTHRIRDLRGSRFCFRLGLPPNHSRTTLLPFRRVRCRHQPWSPHGGPLCNLLAYRSHAADNWERAAAQQSQRLTWAALEQDVCGRQNVRADRDQPFRDRSPKERRTGQQVLPTTRTQCTLWERLLSSPPVDAGRSIPLWTVLPLPAHVAVEIRHRTVHIRAMPDFDPTAAIGAEPYLRRIRAGRDNFPVDSGFLHSVLRGSTHGAMQHPASFSTPLTSSSHHSIIRWAVCL